MYRVTGYFKDNRVTKSFTDLYDAIDFRDIVDAHYPIKVTFEKAIDMREFIYDSWNGVMNYEHNPLRHIPDTNVRHLIFQVLAWMWCIIFSMWVGSFWLMGVSMIAHALILAGVVITVATFETAKRRPTFFVDFPTGTPSRSRQVMYLSGANGKLEKIKLDPKDPGGEHE